MKSPIIHPYASGILASPRGLTLRTISRQFFGALRSRRSRNIEPHVALRIAIHLSPLQYSFLSVQVGSRVAVAEKKPKRTRGCPGHTSRIYRPTHRARVARRRRRLSRLGVLALFSALLAPAESCAVAVRFRGSCAGRWAPPGIRPLRRGCVAGAVKCAGVRFLVARHRETERGKNSSLNRPDGAKQGAEPSVGGKVQRGS